LKPHVNQTRFPAAARSSPVVWLGRISVGRDAI
jgi:hypothetical protein